ncbi:MAG: N-acetylneuraminate synthase [Planctomycetota bacterium]|nr:MAG: N-acetylneuraminate synthase [Planctomycetota bacterium]
MMSKTVKIGNNLIGDGYPVYIIAEIGINHNGDINIAKKLIDAAVLSGCDAVKFQKRTPELCVPPEQRNLLRETPWGYITYIDYREKVELSREDYNEIDRYCKEKHIEWFASCWDKPSVDFIESFDPVCHKIASALLTDNELLQYVNNKNRTTILSTGMSTMEEIEHAVSLLDKKRLVLCHTTSTYPCKIEEVNMRMIDTLKKQFDCPVGYSGHEIGLQITIGAIAKGACLVERHITLDRAMWGSDQAASVEPYGLMRLVRDIRVIEKSFGDGIKKIYESEIPIRQKLRGK